jgi:hypothetical protein
MKKILSLLVFFGLFVAPLVAQVDHDYNANDRIPVVRTSLSKDQVPAAVLASVNKKFDKLDKLTWSKFPYALKEYGWVYDVGASDIALNHFEVQMKTTNGDELWAVYDANGNLIETNEVSKNIMLPADIQQKIANSQYKDWKIVGNKETVRYYHDQNDASVEQHLRVTVEKDNVKRSISFNYNSKKDK